MLLVNLLRWSEPPAVYREYFLSRPAGFFFGYGVLWLCYPVFNLQSRCALTSRYLFPPPLLSLALRAILWEGQFQCWITWTPLLCSRDRMYGVIESLSAHYPEKLSCTELIKLVRVRNLLEAPHLCIFFITTGMAINSLRCLPFVLAVGTVNLFYNRSCILLLHIHQLCWWAWMGYGSLESNLRRNFGIIIRVMDVGGSPSPSFLLWGDDTKVTDSGCVLRNKCHQEAHSGINSVSWIWILIIAYSYGWAIMRNNTSKSGNGKDMECKCNCLILYRYLHC